MSRTRIEERTEALARLYAQTFDEPETTHTNPVPAPPPTNLSDLKLIDRARAARNGARFGALFDGDFGEYESQSEADLALTGMIAFWTGPDRERIDGLFRRSGLVRSKWDETHGEKPYGEITIDTALRGRTEFYSPGAVGGNGHDGSGGQPRNGGGGSAGQPRPAIQIGDRQLRDVTNDVLAALKAANDPPVLFTRGAALVRIQHDEHGRAFVQNVGVDQLIARMRRSPISSAAPLTSPVRSGLCWLIIPSE